MAELRGLDVGAIRMLIADQGYAYLRDVADLDLLEELSHLGPLLRQYEGELVREIRPDPSIHEGVISAEGFNGLRPHTEWYEFPGLPPRYVALWCVSPWFGDGGETTIADGYQLLEAFDVEELQRLHDGLYTWRSHLPTKAGTISVAEHPILERHGSDLILRFSTLDLHAHDEVSRRYVDLGLEYFTRHHMALRIEHNALLIWDNWRMIHARNSFTDPHRHLRRVLIGQPRSS